MQTLAWIAALLIIGTLAGAATGTLLVFTRGHRRWDLVAGQLGALSGGGLLHAITARPTMLPTVLAGLAGAILLAWLTRVVRWAPEPVLAASAPEASPRLASQLMTTGESSRLWITNGRLVAETRGS